MSAEDVIDDTSLNSDQGVKLPMDDPMRAGVHSLWVQDMFMDYTIKAGEREFHVHKVIMSSMSDYFKTMLSGGMNEAEKGSVIVTGVSADVVEILIRYIYTNRMDISEDNAAEILGGAVYFQMKSAIKICTKFMVEKLDPENWFDVLTFFTSYVLDDEVNQVRTYATRYITDIAKTDNSKLPYEELDFVVQNWQSSEYDLFAYIRKWVEADEGERNQYADKLLCLVRFSLMTPQQLDEMQGMKNFCCSPNSWDSLIDKALEYHNLPLHQRVLEGSEQSKVRSAPGLAVLPRDGSKDGWFLDRLREKCFLKHQGLKIPDGYGHPLLKIVVNNFLIVCMMNRSRHTKYQFYIFDPRTLQWDKLPYIDRDIAYAVLAHDKESLYVIGGIESVDYSDQDDTGAIVLRNITRYNFETNEWSEFDTMPVPLRYFATCVLENSLYISGGVQGERKPLREHWDNVNDDDVVNTVHRLDLSSHEWQTEAPMASSQANHQMQVVTISGEELIAIIQDDYSMLLYNPKYGCWMGNCYSFNASPYELQLHHLAWGNSIFQVGKKYEGSEVVCCQVVTFPEDNADHGIVENYEGYQLNGHRTVLAIAPYTVGNLDLDRGEQGELRD